MGAAVLLLLFLLVGVFWQSNQAMAAGADIQITSKRQTVQVGDTVYVVIKISSSTEMSGFEGFFSYDNKLLKFETGGSVVYGNDNEFQISDIDRETKSKVLKYSVKFTARKAGTTSIDLSKPYYVYGESTSDKLSVSYNALALVINKKGTQTQSPVQQTPTVSEKPSNIPQTPPASEKLSDVPQTPTKPKNTKEPTSSAVPKKEETKATSAPDKTGTRAVAKGKAITLYSTDAVLIKTAKESDIPDGFGKTKLEIDGQAVEAYSLESETEHTYVLVYGTANGIDQFYLYDREKDSLYPYDSVKAWYRSGDTGIVSQEQSVLQISNKRLKYIVGILIAVSALLLLGILSLYMKMKGIDPDEIE